MKTIVTLTMNPSLDKSAHINHLKNDTKLRCYSVRMDPGGGGLNVSRALHQLGSSSTAVFPSGGFEGKRLLEKLDQNGINHHAVDIADTIRENLTILEDANEHQYRFGMPGPEILPDELERIVESINIQLETGGILVVSGSLPDSVPLDLYQRLGEITMSKRAWYIVDASGSQLEAALDTKRLFLIKPNLRELAMLAGKEKLEQPEIRETAQALVRRGKVKNVVVSLGAGGAYLINEDLQLKYDSPTVPVDSRIGAGDSMMAGIVGALAEDQTLSEAVRRGVAAGAAAVITPGTELCHAEDARRIYQEVSMRPV